MIESLKVGKLGKFESFKVAKLKIIASFQKRLEAQ